MSKKECIAVCISTSVNADILIAGQVHVTIYKFVCIVSDLSSNAALYHPSFAITEECRHLGEIHQQTKDP